MEKIAAFVIMVAVVVIGVDASIAFGTTMHGMNNNTTMAAATTGDTTTNSQLSSPQANSSNNEVRVFNHEMGETEIVGIPERIVVLEWVFAEDLLALGIQPVGVADIQGMNNWVNLKGHNLSSSVTDVGMRDQPNLEVIAQIDPDLIIGDIGNNGQIFNELSEIAPTLLFDPYPLPEKNISGLGEMALEFITIADIVGRNEQGMVVLERMHQTLNQSAAAIHASNNSGKPFVLVQAGVWEGDVWMRIWSQNGQAAEIIEILGMENAWPVEYERYGFSTIGLEQLTTVQNANFFYIAGAENDNVFETTYKDNPIWNNLQFVQEGRVYPLGEDTWTFGGPISVELMAEKVVGALRHQ